jgi:hypothetical protein
MTRTTAMAGLAILLVAGMPGAAQAVELARWNSSGSVPLAGTFAPTSQHANVTVSNLVASANLLRTGSSPAANTFAAAGYSGADSNAAATAGHYWETVIEPNSGYAISFDSITYRFRRANSGPQWAQWAYSTNGVTFVWLSPAGSNTTTYVDKETTLSAIPALQSRTTKVWFRLYGWLGGTANTAWGAFGQNADVLTFSGTVASAGPVPPSVSFTPSGPQSIAVSNGLNLAVSVTPAGSGLQSWSLLPAYQGSASLTGGNFTFTPATGDDVTQNFTLRVVATNSVGTTTGQVAIAVTAYVPPVPVVAFHPAGPYAIMATETQRLGVAVTPAGSGISSWELTPSNYAGTATLIGTNFTFTTAGGDGPETYTLSVVATNVHGATTGTASIAVTEYAPPPPPGSVVVDFEDGPSKTSYAIATNTLSGRSWLVGGVIGTLEGDKKFDLKALRIRCNATDSAIKLSSLTPFTNGIGSVSLWFASYGNDGTFNMPQVSVQISTNLETGWVTLDTFDTGSATELTYWSRDVNMKVPVYFRLWSPQAGTDRRANIDNLTIAPYVAPTGYEAFLLSYNVTPGDPGTAEGDDLDGDGWTNQQEYLAGTNPYDPAVHP